MLRLLVFRTVFVLGIYSLLFSSCKHQEHKINLVSFNDTIASIGDSPVNKPSSNYTFNLQLKSRDRYYYTINNTVDTRIEYANQKVNTSTASTVELLYQIISDSTNQYQIKITYKKIHIKSKRGDATEEMDADNNYSLNANEKVLSGLKDQSFFITVSKKGELRSVTGYDEIAAHALSQVQIPDENQRKELQDELSNVLGESFIKGNVAREGTLFPYSSLEEGDTWTKNTTQSAPFPVTGVSHYEVENIDSNTVDINVRSDLQSSNKGTVIMGTEVTAILKGNSKTNYHLLSNIGMVMHEKAITNLEGTMQMMGREVPIKINVEKMVDVKKI